MPWKYFRKRQRLLYRSKHIYSSIIVFFSSHHSVSLTTVVTVRTVHRSQYSYYLPKPQLEYANTHFSCWIINCNFASTLSRNTNKMQLCNRIYYSKVYWRLNMFRAAHRTSSGALNFICSLWFLYPCGDWPLPRLSGKIPFSLGNGRYIYQRLQIQFRALDDERCAARNMLSLQ